MAGTLLIIGLSVFPIQSGLAKNGPGLTKLPKSSVLDPLAGPSPKPSDTFPARYAILQTGAISALFNSHAQWGSGFDPLYSIIPQSPYSSFVFPSGSGVDYLWGGALWIGGVVNGDTLVSTGADGWWNITEMYPDGYTASSFTGSVTPIEPVGDQAFRSDCTDTLHSNLVYYYNSFDHRVHKPLPIRIAIRSNTWNEAPANHCILYDLVITNIGTQTINDGYAGLFFNGDVGYHVEYENRNDDVTGFIADGGIAYAADNDGDLRESHPCAGVFCTKLLAQSWPVGILSYNWWSGNGDPIADFGPQRVTTYRNLETGGQGTPEGDRNKYWFLSNGEIDYDQVATCSMAADPNWTPVGQSLCQAISRGYETRFLYSFGPFTLAPDSSCRFIFTTYAIDSFHTDPDNDMNLGLRGGTLNPIAYEAKLNYAGAKQMGAVAESLAQFLVNPATPVYGLRVTSRAADSISIDWDDWCFPTIDGYNIYLSPIPDTAFPYKGTIPPWYQAPTPTLYAQVGRQHRYTFTGLDPKKPYTINVAHRFGSQVGTLGEGLGVRLATEPQTPIAKDTLTFFKAGAGSEVRWHEPTGTPVHHYNLYKFDSTWALKKFLPYYTANRQAYDYTMMMFRNGKNWYYYALPVYATISGNDSTYLDLRARDGDRYAVVAVDSQGYMSGYSAVTITRESTRSKDVLVLYNSSPGTNYVVIDSIKAFYARTLAPYSYDLYSWSDSANAHGCPVSSPTCLDWHTFMRYRLVIVDDGMYDGILTSGYEDIAHGFATYLESGGRLAYCGSFAKMGGTSFGLATAPAFYARVNSLVSNYFGIDSVFYVGALYYKNHATAPYMDSLFGFYRADKVTPATVDLTYDATRDRITNAIRAYWPAATPPSVSTFHLTPAGQTIYTYRATNPAKSINEGQPVGVMTAGPVATTYLYGFHLWSLDSVSAQGLVDWMVSSAPPAPVPARLPADQPEPFFAQNYPNPFNPSTTIAFALPSRAHVNLDIFNVLGQKVRVLADKDMDAGKHQVVWDGTDRFGRPAASGIYFYRLSAGGMVASKKMLLLK